MSTISRRDFLRGVAAGAVSMAGAGFLASYGNSGASAETTAVPATAQLQKRLQKK